MLDTVAALQELYSSLFCGLVADTDGCPSREVAGVVVWYIHKARPCHPASLELAVSRTLISAGGDAKVNPGGSIVFCLSGPIEVNFIDIMFHAVHSKTIVGLIGWSSEA